MLKAKLPIFTLVGILMLTLSGCGAGSEGRATPTPVPQIVNYEKTIFQVERGAILSVRNIMGEVVPSKQEELFFRASGFVTRVGVKQGDAIKKGDVLAEMQVEDIVNQLQQAQIDLDVARASLAKSISQREFDLQRAQADVVIIKAQVELARLDVNQSSGTGRVRAELNLQIAEQHLLLAEQTLKLTKEDMDVYSEQAVKRSELAVERLERMLTERQIVAPFDGIVLRTAIRPAQQVEAYYVAIVIGDPTELVVRAVYDYDLNATLNENTEVTFFQSIDATEGFPVKFMPNFLAVTTSEEKTSSQLTATNYFYFSTPEQIATENLKVGRSVKLVVVLGKKDDVLLLPPAAIREYKGLQFVIVQNGDSRRRVEITDVGLKTPERWEVEADLQEGDQVVGP